MNNYPLYPKYEVNDSE